ncbi:unnamed protein product [Rotaria socialis]|uniref:guanylate cyclase n=7 Tax=Rotaria socialis TaxID=392032 RepID=A0A820I7N6_9BILA|nr:unnamed protein product [Rotaria socialis]CAF3388372.1 unnamed protein product [Rotaria socialis]CAF3422541.1 unnamed protein product [Rotaria socialis]CAF3782178.1 unnamed protein product [Rotaria socialis]CAF4178452.1 unnamed protein product [Rotaria socialis]
MIYGILLESCRDGICHAYGSATWQRVVEELNFESESFTTLGRYDEALVERIAECLSEALGDGGVDFYMQFFGECFVTFFTNYGYDKILRVAGRHFRDFLLSIDQLHDSNRFSFPKMKSPLFHVTEEDENGAVLHYKSKRRGFQQYIIGQLRACGHRFFKQEILARVQDDLSSNECNHIVFRLDFNNTSGSKTKRIVPNPKLSDVTSSTFFKVFPFSIVIDARMRIHHMGDSIKEIFPVGTVLIGRHFDDVFRLIRPDIVLEWNRIISHGRHIVFVIENRIPLRPNASIVAKKFGASSNAQLRLKGQMKTVLAWNMVVFLCRPILTTTEEMLSVGLFLHDLNFYDGSSEILIAGMQHTRTLQIAIDKQQAWVAKLKGSKRELQEWRRKGKRLLYNMMPRHVAQLLQDGVLANSICESHKLITCLFAYSIGFKDVVQKLKPDQIVESINATVNAFDQCSEHFDVFKVETKADSSYMVVAGIQDRSVGQRRGSTTSGSTLHSGTLTEELGGDIKNPLGLNQAEIIAGLSLELIKSSKRVISPLTQQPFPVKIGFHSGSAVGGIVGAKNFQYCLFGDTINTASRITTTGEAGRVHVSDTSYALLRESPYFEIQSKGKTELKGKGTVETYWLVGPKADYMAAAEQDPFRIHEESQSAVGQHQANMYENTAIQKLDPDKTRNGSPPVHRANMARRPSIASGTCPFSGQQLGNKPK